MRLVDLALKVLEHVCAHAVEDSLGAAGKCCGVACGVEAVAAGFDTEELDARIVREGVEHADAVRAAADAGYDCVGELSAEGLELGLGLVTDDGLEGSYDGWEGVWTDSRANDVVGG